MVQAISTNQIDHLTAGQETLNSSGQRTKGFEAIGFQYRHEGIHHEFGDTL
jgi:hypothetical protein